MTMHAAPPALLVPENAPFSPEQRAWLSGYFAALLSPDLAGATPLSAVDAAGLAGAPASPALADAGDAPWHDPSLPLGERLSMAAERPLAPRLMAAMAQQDCGQCGYNCADYANALFLRQEERLNLCAPGGKETLRALRKLAEELESEKAEAKPAAPAVARGAGEEPAEPAPEAPAGTRANPAHGIFLSRRRLNAPHSEKETWHVEIDLTVCGLTYEVGDSLGVFAANHPALVDAVIAQLGARPERPIGGRTLRDHLLRHADLGAAPDALFQLLSYVTGGAERRKAQALAAGEDPDGDAATLDVLGALHKFAAARPDAEAFAEALEPLQPRLYSISSSPKADPGRVALTVDTVRYTVNKRRRLGVASTFFAERIESGTPLRIYVQKAHGFALPADPATPIVMVGPGTGVAPFRAFLRERQALRAPGRNWLFFGHQRQDTDFFYKDELTAMKKAGHLARLTLAWSRQGAEKIYVQDRMREVGADLWRWLTEGAHFYVCGDAKRMARDVEGALIDVVARHGARSTDEAIAFVQGIKKAGRYQADVY
ncbi:MAG TPA: sulfite reductase subunit alpha [Beijerinckiaceae bacterium]|jgi:sulfite reductase (NADPH) flavoprotein alpha-component